MQVITESGGRQTKLLPRRVAIAASILLICLSINFYHAFLIPHPGFTYSIEWLVRDILDCDDDNPGCGTFDDSLMIGDQITAINELSYADWLEDQYRHPYSGFEPGDELNLEVMREGELFNITWQIPPAKPLKVLETIFIPLLIYMPFWLIGSIVLLLMRPKDNTWHLMIRFSYVTAVWLALGLSPTGLSPISRTALAILSWLMAAVYLHFFLEVPNPLTGKFPRFLLYGVYAAAVAVGLMEVLSLLPLDTYILGATIAFVGSIILVVYRSITAPAGQPRVTSRLMLAGVVLAIGPAVLFFSIPFLLDIEAPRQLGIIIPLMAIAILPVIFLYAIYKRGLGSWEIRINRLIYYYSMFLIIFTFISILFVAGSAWQSSINEVGTLALIFGAALLLSFIPLHRRFQRLLDRLAYGATASTEEIYRKLSIRIPATIDRKSIQTLFDSEIMPNLGVEQSAIYLINNRSVDSLYEYNVGQSDRPGDAATLHALLAHSSRYLAPDEDRNSDTSTADWIRLVVPIVPRIGTEGVWLFGRKYPDDFYSHYDIGLIESLADQLAVTIDNMQLMEQVRKELQERERAEQQQAMLAKRVRLIHQVDQAILSADSADEIAQAVIVRIPQLIPCQRASVAIFHKNTATAKLIAVLDETASKFEQGKHLPLKDFDIVRRVKAGDSIVLDENSNEWHKSAAAGSLRSHGLRSILLVPLYASETVIGSLNIASTAVNAFGDEHQNIATEIAVSLEVAIHNAQLMSTIKENQLSLQRLSAKLLKAQESERKRISFELHDEIGQLLTAVTLNVSAAEKALPLRSNSKIRERLADSNNLIEQVQQQVRRLSLELRPSMLQDLGLCPTLRWYLNASARRLDIEAELRCDGLEQRLPEEIEITLYRVVQELMSNAARHGNATEIRIDVEFNEGLLSLEFRDNGTGFEPKPDISLGGEQGGTGLLGIKERIAGLDGLFRIESALGKGTAAFILLPVEAVYEEN